MSGFDVSDSMLYSPPRVDISGDVNKVSFQPIQGQEFLPGGTIKIRVNSQNEFLRPSKSYIKARLRLTGGATKAAAAITILGCSAVFERIVTSIGGKQIEDLQEYNNHCALQYKRAPETQKKLLKQLEFYNDTTALSGSADKYTNGRVFCHALRNCIGELEYDLPLPFCRDLEFEFTLAPLNTLLAELGATGPDRTGSTGYIIDQVEYVAEMIKPGDDYLRDFNEGLNRGAVPMIPMTICRVQKITVDAVSDQERHLPVGYLQSMNQVLGNFKANATLNNPLVDAFDNDTSANLKSYSFKIGSQTYPRNKFVMCNNDVSEGAVDPEFVMTAVSAYGSQFPSFNQDDITANKSNFVYYNWQASDKFGSGSPTYNGGFHIRTQFTSAPAGTERFVLYIYNSAVLGITSTELKLNEETFNFV